MHCGDDYDDDAADDRSIEMQGSLEKRCLVNFKIQLSSELKNLHGKILFGYSKNTSNGLN